jgi:hypothetical protein
MLFGSHADLSWHADLRLPPGGLPHRSIAIFPLVVHPVEGFHSGQNQVINEMGAQTLR